MSRHDAVVDVDGIRYALINADSLLYRDHSHVDWRHSVPGIPRQRALDAQSAAEARLDNAERRPPRAPSRPLPRQFGKRYDIPPTAHTEAVVTLHHI